MFTFFRVSTSIAIIGFFVLSLVTLSDVFIHDNQLFFQVLTISTAVIFATIGLVGIVIYKNFKNIWQYTSKEEQHHFAPISMRRLLMVFGFIALVVALFCFILCIGLIGRMQDGMALFG
ncbi:hypothetical protein Flavo103_43390 [Flavobacterium collinsii]|uniref:hypothetical protein n=1 Tax=Flavobacterium collinsii TaxID=1114861 RepID=UPI0022C8BE1F|nr:hypothetical protein [Flavobacterium collinsii]GIQ61204.1 hypothetical protein Flavo103_43390 [Flavobacterium collinsii]